VGRLLIFPSFILEFVVCVSLEYLVLNSINFCWVYFLQHHFSNPLKPLAHSQTYILVHSQRTLSSFDWYQFILRGDRGTCV